MCNCGKQETCGCKTKKPKCCKKETCGCAKLHSTGCIVYEGPDLPCIGATKGDKIEPILEKIEDFICSFEYPTQCEDGLDGIDGLPGADGLPGPVSITYEGWADDLSGTGFTAIPSHKCYYAITNVIAGATPVASDFSGKWFKINEPVKEFKKANYIGDITNVIFTGPTPGVVPFNSVMPLVQVPIEFINTANSYIDFRFTMFNQVAAAGPDHLIYANIAGTQYLIGLVQADNDGIINVKTRIHYLTPTTVRIITEQINKDTHSTTAVSNVVSLVFENTVTVAPTTTFDIQLEGHSAGATSIGQFEIISQEVIAYNENKLTC
jgi:hypothetical protein